MTIQKEINQAFLAEAKKELAFTITDSLSGEIYKVYQFSDGGSPIYYNRFRAITQMFQRHDEWKVDKSTMDEYLDMTAKYLNDASISPDEKVMQISRLLNNLKFRIDQSNSFTLVYEIASIWFFTEFEDPTDYNYSRVQKNMLLFSRNKTCILPDGNEVNLLAFFLSTPLNRFISFQDLSEQGTIAYLKKLQEYQLSHSLYNLTKLSSEEKTMPIGQLIEFQVEMSKQLIELLNSELRNTTTS